MQHLESSSVHRGAESSCCALLVFVVLLSSHLDPVTFSLSHSLCPSLCALSSPICRATSRRQRLCATLTQVSLNSRSPNRDPLPLRTTGADYQILSLLLLSTWSSVHPRGVYSRLSSSLFVRLFFPSCLLSSCSLCSFPAESEFAPLLLRTGWIWILTHKHSQH